MVLKTWRAPESLERTYHLAPASDVTVDTGDAGVRRGLVGGEFRMHDRVAELAAELNGIGIFIGPIAADGAQNHKQHEGGEKEGDGARAGWRCSDRARENAVETPARGGGASRSLHMPIGTSTSPRTRKAGITM